MARDDRGQAAITMMLVAVVLFVVAMAALTSLGSRVVDRTRAQSAADAAALGSVGGDRATAIGLAGAQGGSLVSWVAEAGGATVTVVVRVGESTASARATVEP
jgi:Flp pilus assembly protein TadG